MGVARAALGAVVVASVAAGAAHATPPRERGHGPKLPPGRGSPLAPKPVLPIDPDAAHVDWARGLVIAGGVGVADRHAPSPAVARGTARRGAEDAARASLAAELPTLPLAAGGALADRLGDAAIKARVDRAVADAITVDAEPETDGAWHVTLAVPVEAVRVALAPDGARAWPPTGDRGAPVIVVDGLDGAGSSAPGLGWSIAIGTGAPIDAAIIWTTALPAFAQHAPHVKAIAAKAGVIALEAAGAAEATAATLFVVLEK